MRRAVHTASDGRSHKDPCKIHLIPVYYTEDEARTFGFKSVGRNVRIAKNAQIIGLDRITIGDNVRIDGFTNIIAAGGRG